MKLFIAGHRGMVGSALVRRFLREKKTELLLRTREELDLCDQTQTFRFLEKEKPDVVIVAAAKVGGIMANQTHPAEFLHQNLYIAANTIEGAHHEHWIPGKQPFLDGHTNLTGRNRPSMIEPIREKPKWISLKLSPWNRVKGGVNPAFGACVSPFMMFWNTSLPACPTNRS